MLKPIVSSALVGIVFGILSNFPPLLGSWLNLVVWAVVGILIGLFIEQKRYITSAGLSYGFFLVVSFLAVGFKGASDKILSFVVLSLFLSIIGAGCGYLFVWIGNKAKKLYGK